MFTHLPISFVRFPRRHGLFSAVLPLSLCALALLAGCNRFRHMHHDKVYVSVRTSYLHDRVAPVSNRVGQVANGQELEVLDHNRRFYKVKTDKNEIGWIEERAVIDSKTYKAFVQLADQHKDDPVAATATLRDDLTMHLLPGRETERFYLLAGNSKVSLLARASAPKKPAEVLGLPSTSTATKSAPATGAAKPGETAKNASPAKPGEAAKNAPAATQAKAGETAKSGAAAKKAPSSATPAEAAPVPEPPAMEDWWLARDAQGRVGWLLSKGLDVDLPDEVAQYAEGQRIVGAWMLAKVTDDEANTPNHQVTEYLTIMAPPKSGLPYDFDQVRVFTWNTRRHRYETGFRLHPIQGYLPVRVFTATSNGKSAPAFSFQLSGNGAIATDSSGIIRPVNPRTVGFALIDYSRVQRIGPDLGPIPLMQDPDKDKKDAAKKAAAAKKASVKKAGKR